MIAPKVQLTFGDPASIRLARKYESEAISDSRKNPVAWEFVSNGIYRCPNCDLEKNVLQMDGVEIKKFQCPKCQLWCKIL